MDAGGRWDSRQVTSEYEGSASLFPFFASQLRNAPRPTVHVLHSVANSLSFLCISLEQQPRRYPHPSHECIVVSNTTNSLFSRGRPVLITRAVLTACIIRNKWEEAQTLFATLLAFTKCFVG